jgi:DNA-binding NarL/FixJ family response regulator
VQSRPSFYTEKLIAGTDVHAHHRIVFARNGWFVVRKNVLIVDDHARIRSALRTVLEISGELKVCGEAADGVEAIEKAGELKPNLILLDIAMPRLTGIATAIVLKQALPGTKVGFCTFYPETGQKVASTIGIDLVIAKSDSANRILEKIRSVLDS